MARVWAVVVAAAAVVFMVAAACGLMMKSADSSESSAIGRTGVQLREDGGSTSSTTATREERGRRAGRQGGGGDDDSGGGDVAADAATAAASPHALRPAKARPALRTVLTEVDEPRVAEIRLSREMKDGFRVQFTARWELYNPVVVVSEDNELHLFARIEGRNASGQYSVCPLNGLHSPFDCPVTDLRMISFIAHCHLDDSFQCRSLLRALPYPLRWDRAIQYTFERELGPEDPRAISIEDATFLVFNGPPLSTSHPRRNIRCMKAQQVLPWLGEPVDLVLPAEEMQRVEKNWSPFAVINATAILLSRFGDPHEVVACSVLTGVCECTHRTESAAVRDARSRFGASGIHLGTNAVLLRDRGQYLAIMHAVLPGRRRYLNLPYLFSAKPPYEITRVAHKPLHLPLGSVGHGFVYTSSLTLVQADQVVVGYNVNDRSAAFWHAHLRYLLDTL